MVRVRLKENCPTVKLNTPYGLITHEWSVVRDDAYIYNEVEVEGLSKPETISIPKPIIDPKPKPLKDPRPEPKLKTKTKKTRVKSVKKKRSKKVK